MKRDLRALILMCVLAFASGATCELAPTLNITSLGYATAAQPAGPPLPPGSSAGINPFPVPSFPNGGQPSFFSGALAPIFIQPTPPTFP